MNLANDITDGEVDKLYESRRKFNAMKPTRDSIFQNEMLEYYGPYLHHLNLPYGNQPDTTAQIGRKPFYFKRKDSAKTIIMIHKITDSIIKRYNK